MERSPQLPLQQSQGLHPRVLLLYSKLCALPFLLPPFLCPPGHPLLTPKTLLRVHAVPEISDCCLAVSSSPCMLTLFSTCLSSKGTLLNKYCIVDIINWEGINLPFCELQIPSLGSQLESLGQGLYLPPTANKTRLHLLCRIVFLLHRHHHAKLENVF